MALKKAHGALLAILILAAAALLCRAEMKSVRKFEIKKKKGEKTLLVTVDYSDIFDEKAKENLDSGLPTVVLFRLYLHKENKDKPVSMALRTCKVIYDIWEENYIATISTTGKSKTKKIQEKQEAMKLCGSVKNMPFPVESVENGIYRFATVVDLNPISKEVLEAMRDWLKRPLGDSGHLNPADSFFGSFITIFVNEKLEPSEKTLTFESQKFKLEL
jgi:hypothetical protein